MITKLLDESCYLLAAESSGKKKKVIPAHDFRGQVNLGES